MTPAVYGKRGEAMKNDKGARIETQAVGDVPRGVEVLIKKAAVDAAFRDCLVSERDGAAEKIGLALEPAEAAMLRSIPAAQLAAVVARTRVSPNLHAAFMTYTAAVMLAALGTLTVGCDNTFGNTPNPTEGIRPDEPATDAKPGSRGSQVDEHTSAGFGPSGIERKDDEQKAEQR